MDYVPVKEARDMPGLRLVLTAHMPGPWGEAAKYVFSARNVAFTPVEQRAMEKNEDLFAWTGMRNAPIAVLDDEPPQSTWLELLLLAERIGSGPSLIPQDPLDRALMMGLSTEICSPDGFAWNRRLEMMGRPSTRNPSGDTGKFDMARMTQAYGVSPETMARAPERVIAIMQGLARQLRAQQGIGSDYLVGRQLSACDLHWAAFSGFVAPLPPELCPMPDFMRDRHHLTRELAEALDPILLEHRDRIYQRHITLPMDF